MHSILPAALEVHYKLATGWEELQAIKLRWHQASRESRLVGAFRCHPRQ
jgi:hypothetical protein